MRVDDVSKRMVEFGVFIVGGRGCECFGRGGFTGVQYSGASLRRDCDAGEHARIGRVGVAAWGDAGGRSTADER